MEKVDRRVRRTQKLLADAFMDLIDEQSYDDITIKDITERADVAYATFFRHYHDKDDFFMKVLEGDMEELKERVEAIPQDGAPNYEYCAEMFTHVQKKVTLYRIMLTEPGAIKIREQMKIWHTAKIMDAHEESYTPGSNIPFEIAANHMAAASMELIDWWLRHDMLYSPERMGQIFQQLIMQGTWQIVAQNAGQPITPSPGD